MQPAWPAKTCNPHPARRILLHVQRVFLGLLSAVLLAACSHVAWTRSTFRVLGASPPELELRIVRHLDTVVQGPDIEEDQTLVLVVREYRLNEPIRVPSPNVSVTFVGKRFGPPSHAVDSRGKITVRAVSAERVTAHLDLCVLASTRDGSYRSTERFRGEYIFRADSTVTTK